MGYLLGDHQQLLAVVLRLLLMGVLGGLLARRWRYGAAVGVVAVLTVTWVEASNLALPSRIGDAEQAGLWAEYGALLAGLAAGLILVALGRPRPSRPAP